MKLISQPTHLIPLIAIFISLNQGIAPAALVPYVSRAAFDADHTTASFEDFEEANVADGSWGHMGNVLDASTNNAVFSTGDIVADLRITVPDALPENILVSSPGVGNYVSHAITFESASTIAPQIQVDFLGDDVTAFALDLTSNPDGNTLTVDVFSGVTNLGSTVVPNVQGAGTFFGTMSDSDIITHITISNGNFFGVDNIAFAVIPEPATLALAGLGLSLFTMRRRR